MLLKEIKLRSVKIVDIGYITIIYFVTAVILAKLFGKLYGKFDEKKEEKKTFLLRTFELAGMMWIIGIVTYIVKNVVELIPFPLDGLYGFNHMLMKELKMGAVFTFVFLFFEDHFKSKLTHYYNSLK
jgi:uncharacterized membrane protein